MWNLHPDTRCSLPVILVMLLAAGTVAAQEPSVRFGSPADKAGDTLHWYIGADVRVEVFAKPLGVVLTSEKNVEIYSTDSSEGEFEVLLHNPQPGINSLCITATTGGESVSKCIVVLVEQPRMKGGVEQWRGLSAMVGRPYDPSSNWESTGIPSRHYATYVRFDRRPVFSGSGTSFSDRDLSKWLVVSENTRKIETYVYWMPGGSRDPEEWVKIFSSQPDDDAVVRLGERRVEISDSSPEQVEGFEFEWVLDRALPQAEFEPITLRQTIGPNRFIIPEQMEISCAECPDYGIRARLFPGLESSWLRLEVVDRAKIARVPSGKRLDMQITMKGRRGTVGTGRVGVTIHLPHAVPSIFDDHAGSTQPSSSSGGRWSGETDRAATEAIRALPQFGEGAVNIYAIEGDALQGIIASVQTADSIDYHTLDAYGDSIIDESEPGFAGMAIQSARRFRIYEAFITNLTSRLAVGCEFDERMLEEIYQRARSLVERENMRPTRFYLVTSSDPRPKPLALLGTRRDGAGSTIVVPTAEAASMRAIFDSIEKKWFARLERSLAGRSSTVDAESDGMLRQVWPQAR